MFRHFKCFWLDLIREHGCRAELSLDPATPLAHLGYAWERLDCATTPLWGYLIGVIALVVRAYVLPE